MASAFISYQTADKKVAGQIKKILAREGIDAFLAHEDIAVSEEWRLEILNTIKKAEVFIAVITKNYLKSIWCIQEAGIAASRSKMTSICLLIDDSTPPGFLQAVQGKKCIRDGIVLTDILPGLVKAFPALVLNKMIDDVVGSFSYRGAEENYSKIIPYLKKLSSTQAARLLKEGYENGQVRHAHLCIKEYIPKTLKMHQKSIGSDLHDKIIESLNN